LVRVRTGRDDRSLAITITGDLIYYTLSIYSHNTPARSMSAPDAVPLFEDIRPLPNDWEFEIWHPHGISQSNMVFSAKERLKSLGVHFIDLHELCKYAASLNKDVQVHTVTPAGSVIVKCISKHSDGAIPNT